MQIIADPSLFRGGEGTFWAGIHLTHGGNAFPDNLWDDIAFGVLYKWGIGCRFLIENEGEEMPFDFMDGDFSMKCTRTADELSVEWIDDYGRPTTSSPFTASSREFLASYITAFDTLYALFKTLDRSGPEGDSEDESLEICLSSRAFIVDYLRRTQHGR